MSDERATPFRALSVLGRSAILIGRKLHVLAAIALVGHSPALLYAWLGRGALGGSDAEDLWLLVSALLCLPLFWMSSALVITLTERWLLGDGAEIGPLARVAARRVIPAVVVGLLFWLVLFGVGFVAWHIGRLVGEPGAVLVLSLAHGALWCTWWVVTPVAIIERPGVIGSFRRSAQITWGNWWRVLGVMALFVFVCAAGSSFWLMHFVDDFEAALPSHFMAGMVLFWAFCAAMLSVLVTVGYVHLSGRISADIEDLAEVFD